MKRLELKEYRKMTGKIAWLANSTHPDLSFTALQLAKKIEIPKIQKSGGINVVLKKV